MPSQPPQPDQTTEAYLRAAERLIYRVLAFPSDDDEGQDEDDGTELPLSQTTVLIRAPRGFKPSSSDADEESGTWIPKQTYSKDLDAVLNGWMQPPSFVHDANGRKPWGGMASQKGRGKDKVPTTGLRIVCGPQALKGAPVREEESELLRDAPRSVLKLAPVDRGDEDDEDEDQEEKDDEMIWWQWGWKIEGCRGTSSSIDLPDKS